MANYKKLEQHDYISNHSLKLLKSYKINGGEIDKKDIPVMISLKTHDRIVSNKM